MTENEAIKVINDKYETFFALSTTNDFDMAMATSIKALEEIQQYKAIGTVEDINKVLSFLGDENKRSIIDDLKLLNEYKATELTPELIEAMQGHNVALINDLGEYQAIGTVEEFKALKEKNVAKKPIELDQWGEYWKCPTCGKYAVNDLGCKYKYCPNCGTEFDWESAEQMKAGGIDG